MEPFAIPHLPNWHRHGIGPVLFQPFLQVEGKKLLAPQHASQGLAHDKSFVFADAFRSNVPIELIGILLPTSHDLAKSLEWVLHVFGSRAVYPQADNCRFTRFYCQLIMCRGFSTAVLRIDSVFVSVDYKVMESIFYVATTVRCSKEPLVIGFILCKQEGCCSLAI